MIRLVLEVVEKGDCPAALTAWKGLGCASLSFAMANELIIPIAPVKLARAAWLRIAGVLLLGLLGALALGYLGYRLDRLDDAVTAYQSATLQYQMRNQALQSVNQMEEVFDQFLLRGDRSLLQYMSQPKNNVEQLAQREVNGQRDHILENLVVEEKKWYDQTVTPMIEARQKVAAGQPFPDHFFDAYQPLDRLGFLNAHEQAQNNATAAMLRAYMNPRWLWLPYPLAGLLIVGMVWLGAGAIKRVSYLRQAAENEGEEDEDGKENQHDEEAK